MRIDGDGVGKLDAANEIAMLVGKNGGGSVGSVNVEPELVTARNFGESNEIVDGAGVGGAGGADDAEGLEAGGEICADRGFERGGIELHARVYGDAAKGAASESQQANGFVERMMAFRGSVENWLGADRSDTFFNGVRKVSGEGHRKRGEIGFVATAGKGAVEGGGPADTFADPAHGFGFNLRGELRAREAGELRIERGDQGFGENGDVSRRGIHQAEVVRGGNVESLVDELSGDVVENARGIGAEFGHGVAELIEGALPGRQLNGAVRERIEVGVNAVDELIAELAARFVVESEIHWVVRPSYWSIPPIGIRAREVRPCARCPSGNRRGCHSFG